MPALLMRARRRRPRMEAVLLPRLAPGARRRAGVRADRGEAAGGGTVGCAHRSAWGRFPPRANAVARGGAARLVGWVCWSAAGARLTPCEEGARVGCGCSGRRTFAQRMVDAGLVASPRIEEGRRRRLLSANPEVERLRASPRWRMVRAAVLRAEPTCRRCRSEGRASPATDVHHVRRASERPDLFFERSNLEPACKPCHAVYTALERAADRDAERNPPPGASQRGASGALGGASTPARPDGGGPEILGARRG